jgi:hypothetical protein
MAHLRHDDAVAREVPEGLGTRAALARLRLDRGVCGVYVSRSIRARSIPVAFGAVERKRY